MHTGSQQAHSIYFGFFGGMRRIIICYRGCLFLTQSLAQSTRSPRIYWFLHHQFHCFPRSPASSLPHPPPATTAVRTTATPAKEQTKTDA